MNHLNGFDEILKYLNECSVDSEKILKMAMVLYEEYSKENRALDFYMTFDQK